MIRQNIPHESAVKHVTGEAVYVDDILVNDQLLTGRVVYSPHAHATIASFDLREAKKVPGVHAVLSYLDVPGRNQMGPVVKDEVCLAEQEVVCVGQAMFLIAAEQDEQCREAERKIQVEFEPREPILTLEKAMGRNSLLGHSAKIARGDADGALKSSPHVITGELTTGAQEHWYLESQVCLCLPGEGREMNVFSSTQHPSETQALIAELLGIGKHEVTVEVRRMGGAFGGKETQANHTACWAALLCHATRRPVKVRLFRDDDMIMTGKRHRFLSRYTAGFDHEGKLLAASFELNSDGGCATDLSHAIMQRAMLHADNAYYIPHCSIVGTVYKTNLPSNTAFRGFGGPQGMALIEQVIEQPRQVLRLAPHHLNGAFVVRLLVRGQLFVSFQEPLVIDVELGAAGERGILGCHPQRPPEGDRLALQAGGIRHLFPRLRYGKGQGAGAELKGVMYDEHVPAFAFAFFDHIQAGDAKFHAAVAHADHNIRRALEENGHAGHLADDGARHLDDHGVVDCLPVSGTLSSR